MLCGTTRQRSCSARASISEPSLAASVTAQVPTTLWFYAAWVNEADSRGADAIANVMPRPVVGRHSPRNPYEELAAKLREAIADGTYKAGTPLPPTTALAAEHSVSVGTVNRTVALLKTEGLIQAGRGRRATVVGAN
jgi:integrase